MSLKKQIEEKLNQALKNKEKQTYPTLRLIVSAIKDAEIANRTKDKKDMSDSDISAILKKMIKQRNESCEVYKKAGRTELLESETKEIEIINTFLPKQLTVEETKKICEETIKSVGASSMKDMGKIMGEFNKEYGGKADNKVVSRIVRNIIK